MRIGKLWINRLEILKVSKRNTVGFSGSRGRDGQGGDAGAGAQHGSEADPETARIARPNEYSK